MFYTIYVLKWEIIILRNIDPSSNKRRPRNELTKKVLHMTDINHGYFGANSAEVKSIRDYLAERFWEERQSYEQQ